jgi:aryl-alcohol dehydrogenase-like predicted oxidoreductase
VDRRTLGHSDLTITSIGLGTWAIGGGDWVLGWGPQKDADSVTTIRRAVELGINWIETAAVYGLGHSETLIARALREIPQRERPHVFTMCSLVWDELGNVAHSLEPRSIRREAEASLRRLDIDTIDLYQIGWPIWPKSPPGHDPGSLEAAWDTMASLKREGKVRFIGVSNCDRHQLTRLQRIAPVTSLQTRYSLLSRDVEDRTLPFCQDRRLGVLACSPMHSGLLTGTMTPERVKALPHNDWRRRSPDFQEPFLSCALRVNDRLRAVAGRYARTPGEVAIAWTLRHPAVTAVVVGARRPDQVDTMIGATTLRLATTEIESLDVSCPLAYLQSSRVT